MQGAASSSKTPGGLPCVAEPGGVDALISTTDHHLFFNNYSSTDVNTNSSDSRTCRQHATSSVCMAKGCALETFT